MGILDRLLGTNTESDGTGNVRKPDREPIITSSPRTREANSGGGAETTNPTTRPRGGENKPKTQWKDPAPKKGKK